MSGIYTYEIDPELFLENLIGFLKQKRKKTRDEVKIINLLNNSRCFIENLPPNRPIQPKKPNSPYKFYSHSLSMLLSNSITSENYRDKLDIYNTELDRHKNELEIYNRYKSKSLKLDTIINFSITYDTKINNKTIEKTIDICNQIMPPETGFYIKNVRFKPMLKEKGNYTTVIDINDAITDISNEIIKELLPQDIKQNGREMAEVYLYLYVVENSLRLFIKKIGIQEYGDDYFDQLKMNNDIKKSITGRKQKENKERWLKNRGDSDLFYLDFEDINSIIQNNWNIFKPYFPDQNWITTKIKELASCRHLVAHNSLIDAHGRDVIKTYYTSILKQLDFALRENG